MKVLFGILICFFSIHVLANTDCGLGPSLTHKVNLLCVGDQVESEGTVIRVFDMADDYDQVEFLNDQGQKYVRWITSSMKKVKKSKE